MCMLWGIQPPKSRSMRMAPAIAALRDSTCPLIGIATIRSAASRIGAETPAPSLPRTSARRGGEARRAPRSRHPLPPPTAAYSTPGACPGRSAASASRTGSRNDDPAAARTTFGPHGSAVPGRVTTPPAPSASAARISVPDVPGIPDGIEDHEPGPVHVGPRPRGKRRRGQPALRRHGIRVRPQLRVAHELRRHPGLDRFGEQSPGRLAPPRAASVYSTSVTGRPERRSSARTRGPSTRNSPRARRSLRRWSARTCLL